MNTATRIADDRFIKTSRACCIVVEQTTSSSEKQDKKNASKPEKVPLAGITVKKADNISEWYTQVLQKAELIDYSLVSGCYVLRPRLYAMWEKVQQLFDVEIKRKGVQNAYFPMLIPESLLNKEAHHVNGFSPEVAWVTQGGNSPLPERLAIRPTSETIMYESFAKWIRSHRDLPLKLNQWCNVVRWEFKHPTPLLRSREFLWQEGHTAHATHEEAAQMALDMLNVYAQLLEDVYALPILRGKKSQGETFAGAIYSLSCETFFPSGKGIQICTSHHLGTNFSKAFDIGYLNDKGNHMPVHQTSWGISTRSLGILVLFHGDDKGLVLPPKIAPTQIVIVPIYFAEVDKKRVMSAAVKIRKSLETDFSVILDDREEYTPGWKYNDWEMKGACMRIEIGPKDIANEQVMICRRDVGKKEAVPIAKVKEHVGSQLRQMQKDMLTHATERLVAATVEVTTNEELLKALAEKKLIKTAWCALPECEAALKEKTDGAKSMNIPFEQPEKLLSSCTLCGKTATVVAYVAKAY